MARDFSKVIADTQAKHDAQLRKEAEEAAVRKEASDRKFEAATGYLNKTIRPMLEDASKQLAQQGMPVKIKDNWSEVPSRMTLYSLSFLIEGPSRTNRHGGTTTPRSIAAFFQHDGTQLKVGLAASEYETTPRNGTQPIDDARAEEAVDDAVEKVITSYLDKVAEYRRQGTWD